MMETKSWKRPIIAQSDAQSRRIKRLMVSTSRNAFHLPP